MTCLENPIVLVTRPRALSNGFVEALRAVAGPFRPLVAPAFEFAPTGVAIHNFDTAIFTSGAGVAHAPQGEGRAAYCVGDATAHLAQANGYEAVSAAGAASDLTRLILARRPEGRLLHIRGEASVGDICAHLTAAGLEADEAIAYRKVICPSDTAALAALDSREPVVLPLFSAETVSIIAGWNASFASCHVVAISHAVAAAARDLSPPQIIVADHPSQEGTINAAARLIA